MKILVVIDMQNDFLHGALKNEKGIEIIPAVVERINQYKKDNWLVVATRDTHSENYLQTQEGKKLPVKHCVKYSWGWRINEEIEKALGEVNSYNEQLFPFRKMNDNNVVSSYTIVFDKYTFGSYDLANYLTKCYGHIQNNLQIELVGVCTDICVISNAMLLKAFMPEATIIVNGSLCAGVSEKSHNDALNAMGACQIEII